MPFKKFYIKYPLLILALTILVIYWPLSTFTFMPKWDMVDISFPWRTFIIESLHQKILPLWNPYQYLGFAQHTDLQTWYFPVWLFSIFKSYTIYAFISEYLMHLIIAAWGMYYLSSIWIYNIAIRYYAAITYILSGFFIGNAQHLGWIISAAWIPWIIYSYLQFLKSYQLKWLLSVVLFLFLLFTGGYPAFFITVVYILTALFIRKLIWLIKNKVNWYTFITKHTIGIIIWITISLPALYSAYSAQGEITRGSGLSVKQVITGSLYLKNLISAFFPILAYAKGSSYWQADQSMMNIYAGFITLFLATLYVFSKSKGKTYWLPVIAVFFLMMSLGAELPFRKMMYYVLPGFAYFRFPALFRLFYIGAIILMAAKYLQFLNNNPQKIKKVFVLLYLYSGLLIILTIAAWTKAYPISITYNQIFAVIPQLGISHVLLFNGLLLIILIICCFVANKTLKSNWLVTVAIVDIVLFGFLSMPLSVVANHRPAKVQAVLNTLPKGFPTPDLTNNILNNSDSGMGFENLWRNMHIFYKKVAFDGFSPYQYPRFEKMEQSVYFKNWLNNPLLYVSDQTCYENELAIVPNNSLNKLICIPDSVLLQKSNINLVEKIEILTFSPNHVQVQVTINKPVILIFQQNYIKGWFAEINDANTGLFTANYTQMAVKLNTGTHRVTFYYMPAAIKILTIIGLLSFLVVMVITLTLFYKNKFGYRRLQTIGRSAKN